MVDIFDIFSKENSIAAFLVILFKTILATFIGSRIETYQLESEILYRFRNNTTPTFYDLTLETWMDEGRLDFNGSVNILVKVIEDDTNSITLHSRLNALA